MAISLLDDLGAQYSNCFRRGSDGQVTIGGVAVSELLSGQGGRVYVIDEADLRQRIADFKDAFPGWHIHYAGKAFLCGSLIRLISQLGINLDVCSLGELSLALYNGFEPRRITLHGNNKTEAELQLAWTAGIGHVVVDSLAELQRIAQLAPKFDSPLPVLLRITPGVEAHTHEFIATAHEDQKFGFSLASGAAWQAINTARELPGVELRGIHCHIGSQIFDTDGFAVATARMVELLAKYRDTFQEELPDLVLGGGFGIAYLASDQPLATVTLGGKLRQIVADQLAHYHLHQPRVAIEPGRSIIGPAGTTLYQVGTIKDVKLADGTTRRYVSVPGGMSDNIRPALYDAQYSAVLANRTTDRPVQLGRIVGSHCESGDILIRDILVPNDLTIGDVIAIPATGAYCYAMASNYNMTPRPAVLAVLDGKVSEWVRAETLLEVCLRDPAGIVESGETTSMLTELFAKWQKGEMA